MLTRKISKTGSWTYYYLFYLESWCINWRSEDLQRHDVWVENLSNFLLFSIPLFDIELLMSVIIDCIIPWFISNSCQPTSTNSNQLSWWLHFSPLYSFSLVIHMKHPSWFHDCFSYSRTSCDMLYVVLIVKCTYCVWYSCCFDQTVQFQWICLLQIFFLTAKYQSNVYF